MRFFYGNGWTDQGTSTWAWRRTAPLVSSSIFGWYLSYFIYLLSFIPKYILRAVLYSYFVSGESSSVRVETRRLHTPVRSLQLFPRDTGSTWNANRKLRIHWLVFSYKQQIFGKDERRATKEPMKRKWRDVYQCFHLAAARLPSRDAFWPERHPEVTSSW